MLEIYGMGDRAVKLLSAQHTEWLSDDAPNSTMKQDVQSFMRELLLGEDLVILTGLGTSLCIENRDGRKAPTMKDLWEAVQRSTPQFEEIQDEVRFNRSLGNNIEALLSQCQVAQSFSASSRVDQFISTAEEIIASKCDFVGSDTPLVHHETFLRRVARRSTRQPRLKLFTTNYDLAFEMAAANTQFVVVDGFSHTYPQRFDGSQFGYDLVRREGDRGTPDYIPNVFHLYKLHGSLDWTERKGEVIKGPPAKRPVIIYPRHSKFEVSYEQPYLEMMSRFQMALRQPNTGVIVVGFGFNDRHLVQPLLASVRSNVSMRLLVVSPDLNAKCDPDDPSFNPDIAQLHAMILAGDTRLAMLTAKFEELVPMLPDIVPETEEERYRQRILGGDRR